MKRAAQFHACHSFGNALGGIIFCQKLNMFRQRTVASVFIEHFEIHKDESRFLGSILHFVSASLGKKEKIPLNGFRFLSAFFPKSGLAVPKKRNSAVFSGFCHSVHGSPTGAHSRYDVDITDTNVRKHFRFPLPRCEKALFSILLYSIRICDTFYHKKSFS